MISVKSRAHRTLRRFKNFTQDLGECNKFLTIVDKDLYEHQNDLVGVYFNEKSQPFFSIGIFERGLLFCDPELEIDTSYKFIRFNEIESSKTPEHKLTASNIELRLKSGDKAILPILGGTGKFRDVFEFQRFLLRVLEDLKEN